MKEKMKFGKPYKVYITQKRKRKYSRVCTAILISSLIIYILCLFFSQISPTVEAVSQKLLEVNATKIINEAVLKSIDGKTDSLVKISRSESGDITSITADAVELNKLKSSVTLDLLNSLENISTSDFSVPLGNFTDFILLSGLGPHITFKLIPYGSAKVDFRNSFSSAGINQTRHEIYIDISADIGAISPISRVHTTVTTSVLASETIVTGKIPRFFSDNSYEQNVKD